MSFWKRKNELEEAASTQEVNKPELNKPSSASTETVKSVSTGTTAAKEVATSQTSTSAAGTTDATTAELSVEEHINQRYGKVRSALGAGTVIQGKLSFDTPVRIDGKLSGEIFSSKALIVGPTGQIDARVEAASLVILGSVKGDVKATERIELLRGGQLEGHISTPVFTIESTARFNGTCDMSSRSKVVPVGNDASKTSIITAPNVDLEEVIANSSGSSSSSEKKANTSKVGSSATEITAS